MDVIKSTCVMCDGDVVMETVCCCQPSELSTICMFLARTEYSFKWGSMNSYFGGMISTTGSPFNVSNALLEWQKNKKKQTKQNKRNILNMHQAYLYLTREQSRTQLSERHFVSPAYSKHKSSAIGPWPILARRLELLRLKLSVCVNRY